VCGRRPCTRPIERTHESRFGKRQSWYWPLLTPSGPLLNLAVSRPTDAGQQPPHYLSVRIATGRESLHRLLSEGLGLLFGLSFVLRKRHPFADDFAARLVFRLHAQSFTPNGGRRQHKGRVRCFRSRQGDEDAAASVGGLVSPIYESTRREK
jgi:hypothetical protein